MNWQIENMENTCVAYGCFDSMHKGHMAVAEKVKETAQEKGLTPVIISCPKPGRVLQTEEEKIYLFQKAGIETVLTFPYEGGGDCTETEFVQKILADKLGAKALVIGEGHAHLGEIQTAAAAAGIDVVLCETQEKDGHPITDEMVKEVFDACKFDEFIELCGHPYIMIGEVEHGKALGRTVGMPTANLSSVEDKIKPLDGVYATVVHVDDELYKSMTNIVKRPTVDSYDYVTIEAFILDFSRDIYGKTLVLEVHQFVRGVQKFANLEEVQKQVQKDIQKVREVFENAVNENN